MTRDLANLPGCLQAGDYAFLCEKHYQEMPFPRNNWAKYEKLSSAVRDKPAIPDLQNAPLASWYLARLAHLAGPNFPYSYGQVLGSDGADFWLRFYCLKKPATPVAVLVCCGKDQDISLSANYSGAEPADEILQSFFQVLLEKPAKVSKTRVIVQYTDFTDPEVTFQIPRVYGWDGQRFLNETSPEHALDPSEYE